MEMTIELKAINKYGKPSKYIYAITEKNGKFVLKHHVGCVGEGSLAGNVGKYESFDEAWYAAYNCVERSGLI